MTLDEAIRHAEEVAMDNINRANILWDSKEKARCKECAADHRQLAEWLKELKEYREQSGDAISRQAVLDLAKDLTFEGGCKHRCVDVLDIYSLPTMKGRVVEE